MNTKSDPFYNRFSFLYPVVDVFLRPQKNVLFSKLESLPPGELLEIGVGNGAHLHHYKCHRITAIDTSQAMLAEANRRKPDHVNLLQMNGQMLSFPDHSFDYVVLAHVIAVVDDPDQLLEEVFRVLKPRGLVFVLNHFTPDNWLRHVDHAFAIVSKVFHFKSVFHISDLKAFNKFSLLQEVCFGSLSYFKLLIFQKK